MGGLGSFETFLNAVGDPLGAERLARYLAVNGDTVSTQKLMAESGVDWRRISKALQTAIGYGWIEVRSGAQPETARLTFKGLDHVTGKHNTHFVLMQALEQRGGPFPIEMVGLLDKSGLWAWNDLAEEGLITVSYGGYTISESGKKLVERSLEQGLK